jgi:hypothetical protein
MENRLTIKGVSDEVLECQKCGKVELKRTVVLTDGVSAVYYGSACAARVLCMRKGQVDRIANDRAAGRKARTFSTPIFRGGRFLGYA